VFDSVEVAASYSFRIEGLDFGEVTIGLPLTPQPDDDVTRVHFHAAPANANGPIVFGLIDTVFPGFDDQDHDDLDIALNPDGSWTVSGSWETTDTPSITTFSAALNATFAEVLDSATVGTAVPLYFNVHTDVWRGRNPGSAGRHRR
jgi:serralysin